MNTLPSAFARTLRLFRSSSSAALPFSLIFAAICFVFTMPACAKYDELVEKDQVAEQKWSDYEAQLQRRYDLVPNLVQIVKGSAKHEEDTLAKVTEARASATSIKLSGEDLTDPEKVAAFQKAQDQLKGSLSRLLLTQESYPDLKANAGFRDLQVQLEGTENRILRSREQYNAAVRITTPSSERFAAKSSTRRRESRSSRASISPLLPKT